jgi:hypothetical protein
LQTDDRLYRRKADTWTKTNVATHIDTVLPSGRHREIRILKLWRDEKGLEFPSFYLELAAINALAGVYGGLAANVATAFQHLANRFTNARVVDPANTNNIISDDLTASEKGRITLMAAQALKATNWNEVVDELVPPENPRHGP